MRQIKFRGRLEDTDKIIFFELGEVESVADGLFSKRFDDYVVDIEQFIATDKNGYDVYEGDTLKFLFYIDRDGNAAPYKREVSRRAEIQHIIDIQIGFAIFGAGTRCRNLRQTRVPRTFGVETMTELIVAQNNLPASIEDLSKFVLVGRDKLQAVRAEISALNNLNLAKEVREQKLAEGQEIGKLVLLAEARLGDLFNQMPKAGHNQYTQKETASSSRPEKAEIETPKPKPKIEVAKDMGFSKDQVSQFQKLADNPDAVQKAIDDAKENDEIVTRSKALENIKAADVADGKKPHVSFNSGNNEWYTPHNIIEDARKVLGNIDLDPASSAIANETVKAAKFFTADDDGLVKIWEGNIWLNPPYASGLIEKFVDKLLASNFQQAIVLVNNATDTEWFSHLAEIADAIVFPKGRVKFHKPDGSTGAPLQGQAIMYFGLNVVTFIDTFKHYGRCWQ